MPKSNSPTSQWTANGAAGLTLKQGYLVEVEPGVYTIDRIGPPDAYFVETAPGVFEIDALATEGDLRIVVTPMSNGADLFLPI